MANKKKSKKTSYTKQSLATQRVFVFPIFFTFLLIIISFFLKLHPFSIPSQRMDSLQASSLKLSVTPTTMQEKKTKEKNIFGITKVQAAESTNDYCVEAPILFYHHVEPLFEAQKLGHAQFTVDSGIFSQQLDYLQQQGYNVVTLESIVDAIRYQRELPEKSVALTFDDGYVDAYTYALPLLQQHNMFGSFMIPTGLIGNYNYMSWDQVKELASSMPVYNHTLSHAYLPGDSPEKQEFEISHAKLALQDNLQSDTRIFTYPYGAYNDNVIRLVQEQGYVAGISTLPGTKQCASFLMTLHRTRIGNAPLSNYGL